MGQKAQQGSLSHFLAPPPRPHMAWEALPCLPFVYNPFVPAWWWRPELST